MRKITVKSLQKKNWELTRKIIRLLRGDSCELSDCQSGIGLQVDHCFSRTKRAIFYDLSNLTILCESCHLKKSFGQGDRILKVFEHVEGREGETKFIQLRKIAKQNKPFPNWSTKTYQEKINKDLTKKLESLIK